MYVFKHTHNENVMMNSLSTCMYVCLEGGKKRRQSSQNNRETHNHHQTRVCGIRPAVAVASRCVWLAALGSEVVLLWCAYACFNVMQALSSGNSGSLKAVEASLSISAVAATIFTFF